MNRLLMEQVSIHKAKIKKKGMIGQNEEFGSFLQSITACWSKNEQFKTLHKDSDLAGLETTLVILIHSNSLY